MPRAVSRKPDTAGFWLAGLENWLTRVHLLDGHFSFDIFLDPPDRNPYWKRSLGVDGNVREVQGRTFLRGPVSVFLGGMHA